MLTVTLTKAIRKCLSHIGRGSSLPGGIALKLSPDILTKLTLPDRTIAVTGSNGKTSTTELIRRLAERAELSVVSNAEGSNQIEGIATALLDSADSTGTIKADLAVLESDERFCQYVFRQITPDAVIITNLCRDQMTRNGHSEFVRQELQKGLPANAKLIMNADDPISASLANQGSPVIWFGVEPEVFRENASSEHSYDDGAFCPVCHSRMRYLYRTQSQLGSYHCDACGYKRPKPDHAVTGFVDNCFILDGFYRVEPEIPNLQYAYNIVAAYSAAVEILGIPPEKAARYLSGIHLNNKLQSRIKSYSFNDQSIEFLLCKHENTLTYNAAFSFISATARKDVSVVMIVDQLSRKYIADDMSWLWDLDLAPLKQPHIRKIIFAGAFADDLSARALLSGIDRDMILSVPNLNDIMSCIQRNAVGTVYVTTCFTDAPKFDMLCRKMSA